jgi:Cu(I)/Ag(I) efflux system protein CusF
MKNSEMNKPAYTQIVLLAFAILAIHVDAAKADAGQEGARINTSGKPCGLNKLPLADGEVEDVDLANRYLILKHGPIANLNMEAMTMAFAVKAPGLLAKVKVGDKVKFTAENVEDVPTIMSLRVRK